MIVAVCNEKGGVGKSTISSNLAIYHAQQGHDVLLVDADPQGSVSEFVKVREDENVSPSITCVAITGKSVNSEVRKLASKYDTIIIDAGGRDSAGLRSSLLVADVLLVPFLAGQFDLWGVENMSILVENALAMNENLKAYAILNKGDTNPRIGLSEEALTIANKLSNIKLLDVRMGYRVAYRRSTAEGRALNELDKKDPKALQEMERLYKEVFGHGV